jgi:hypothetical protein
MPRLYTRISLVDVIEWELVLKHGFHENLGFYVVLQPGLWACDERLVCDVTIFKAEVCAYKRLRSAEVELVVIKRLRDPILTVVRILEVHHIDVLAHADFLRIRQRVP